MSTKEFKAHLPIVQTAYLQNDGQFIKYPSVFFVLEKDGDYTKNVKDLLVNHDAKLVIVGQINAKAPTVYTREGEETEYGSEIVSANGPDEFKSEDHFRVGGVYYRFVDGQA